MSAEDRKQNGRELRYRFGEFVLEVRDRQLWRGDTRIDLNPRYLDALVLLVRNRGRLVEKDRFFEKVWDDVVVSDGALTQCIKEVRKLLGDDASNPRFIKTVPRHGYRFIGDVEVLRTDGHEPGIPTSEAGAHRPETVDAGTEINTQPEPEFEDSTSKEGGGWHNRLAWHDALYECGAGTLGGGIAGLLGGLLYGFGLASANAEVGTLSTLVVLVALSVLVGLTGGLGVSLGLAGGGLVGRFVPELRAALRGAGAAVGGLFIGTSAKLLGVDAFNLLFGHAPAGITGGPEGAVLGGALALGAYLGDRWAERAGNSARWPVAAGAGIGGATAGALIPLVGGNLMGGSLDLLTDAFLDSRLQLDRFGPLFGELHFGDATQVALSGIEGLLFGSCVVGTLVLASYLRSDGSSRWRP